MTAEDKKQLYTFLTTVEDWINGYKNASQDVQFADDIDLSRGFASLGEIAEQVASCKACRLSLNRSLAVPGEGPAGTERIQVVVIGEGPGADEDASGRPFVGKAGQLLDKMLAAISLSRSENCFIANIVKCRPPQNREPSPDEVATCLPFLEAQIALANPLLILALGRTAAQTLLGTPEGITMLRGRFYDYRGIPVLPTYHPSALLRDEALKRPAWEDLKLFRAELDRLISGDR